MATRIIHFTNENGSKEGVYFTDDMNTPAEDFIPPFCELGSDTTIDDDMPNHFPMNYTLWRE